MDDPAASAELLEKILGLEQNGLLASLKSERGFVWIAKGIDPTLAAAIKERKINGIYQAVETKRFYPNHETAAHAVGFVENGQGLDGMEFQYNSLLRGDEINKSELQALHFDAATEFSRTGAHMVLNLDLMLQAKIERFLEKRVKITGAVSGGVLLLDANTGGILAMASYPAFNPNRYWEFSSSALNNHVITEPVYPGELALIFQQAAAINFKHARKSQALGSPDDAEPLLVIEPDIFKRRALSVAPPVENVDPEYFVRFAGLLGFGQKPLTDLPLKDETPVSSSLVLTDPTFHSSALRLLTAFTALMNKGRVVTPHLLHTAYPKDSPAPAAPTLTGLEQTVSLHPATSKDLIDFLAAKWLRTNCSDKTSQMPMFFETHRVAPPLENSEHAKAAAVIGPTGPISQSIMLGAIPGRDPKLTMIAVLSYPDSSGEIYSDALEAFGNKLSILSPDQDMIKKMLYVADQPPLVPSPDFWTNGGTALAASIDPLSPAKKNFTDTAESRKNMPDVTGKSLRAGLQALQHFNLDIKLVGSGRIVSQQPAAGAELKNGGECILKMQQEI
jgi:cell division protein FtsI (penicillin-binding protein 3)